MKVKDNEKIENGEDSEKDKKRQTSKWQKTVIDGTFNGSKNSERISTGWKSVKKLWVYKWIFLSSYFYSKTVKPSYKSSSTIKLM